MTKWYTQPKNSFSSFYYFDPNSPTPNSRTLVRIRLELGRSSGSGETKAMYTPNRYFGFSQSGLNKNLFAVKNNLIITTENGGMTLTDKPTAGLYVYDFRSDDGIVVSGSVHNGNPVTTTAKLPISSNGTQITEKHLMDLASLAITNQADVDLTDKNATEAELGDAILHALGL